ncbi:MAG: D-alanyl-D-alanine carboxypeptidase family protein [Verrucomicrobiota bacterium]
MPLRFLALLSLLSVVACQVGCIDSGPAASGSRAPSAPPLAYQDPLAIARPLAAPAEAVPVVSESAIVINADTGHILYAKNIDERRAVASTQKLLTALLVIKEGHLGQAVTVVAQDTEVEPTKIGVKAGERYTRLQLLEALLIKSGNDIANVLARDHSGSYSAFVQEMNTFATLVGMKNSRFLNAHGLTEPGQFSTARDIARLGWIAHRVPLIRKYVQTNEFTFSYADGRRRVFENTNKVLARMPACTGMKTGYTRASGRCLVSSAEANGKRVIAVALGGTHRSIWDDSVKLLKFGLTQ